MFLNLLPSLPRPQLPARVDLRIEIPKPITAKWNCLVPIPHSLAKRRHKNKRSYDHTCTNCRLACQPDANSCRYQQLWTLALDYNIISTANSLPCEKCTLRKRVCSWISADNSLRKLEDKQMLEDAIEVPFCAQSFVHHAMFKGKGN